MSFIARPLSAAWIICQISRCISLAGFLAFVVASGASAHEGHDHGPAATLLPASVKPRVAIETDLYQLVAIANGGDQLTIFLDRYATNEPVTDASIGILAGNQTIAAAPRSDGSYLASIPNHRPLFEYAVRHGKR